MEEKEIREIFNRPFGNGADEVHAEANRYVLLIAPMCPWGQAVNIIRIMTGLEKAISVKIAEPVKTELGWEYSEPIWERGDKKLRYLSEAYEHTYQGTAEYAAVPSVLDQETGKIVLKTPKRIAYFFEEICKPLQTEKYNLVPEEIREEIEVLDDFINININKGIYNVGLADSQISYNQAYQTFFESLDKLENRLSNRRYLLGDRLTDADIWLFVTLVRFDAVYYSAFYANRNRLTDFPNLWEYAKDLYSIDVFRETTDFHKIKQGYYLGKNVENSRKIVPNGPDLSMWDMPNNRSKI